MAVSLSRTVSEVSGSILSDTASNLIPIESLVEMDNEEIKQTLNQIELINKFTN